MIKLFNEKPIGELFRLNDDNIIQELNSYKDIETADSEKFSETIYLKFKIEVPIIKITETKVIPAMEGRPGSSFNSSVFADPNKMYQVAVVTYSIPYIGDGKLFSCQPNQFSAWSYYAWTENGHLNFKIYTEYASIDLSEEIRKNVISQAQYITDKIKLNLEILIKDCTQYNSSLKFKVKTEIENRKLNINKMNDLKDRLNPFK